MTRGRKDSPYEPDSETMFRLLAWKRGCDRRLTVRQIADSLRITPATLVRSVQRARERGHPLAVRHPLADTYSVSHGFIHTVSPSKRARRLQRLAFANEPAREYAARDTLRDEDAPRAR